MTKKIILTLSILLHNYAPNLFYTYEDLIKNEQKYINRQTVFTISENILNNYNIDNQIIITLKPLFRQALGILSQHITKLNLNENIKKQTMHAQLDKISNTNTPIEQTQIITTQIEDYLNLLIQEKEQFSKDYKLNSELSNAIIKIKHIIFDIQNPSYTTIQSNKNINLDKIFGDNEPSNFLKVTKLSTIHPAFQEAAESFYLSAVPEAILQSLKTTQETKKKLTILLTQTFAIFNRLYDAKVKTLTVITDFCAQMSELPFVDNNYGQIDWLKRHLENMLWTLKKDIEQNAILLEINHVGVLRKAEAAFSYILNEVEVIKKTYENNSQATPAYT